MMKILKNFIYMITATFLMIMPAMAGQVELQTECQLYTVKEALTDEKQRAIDATINYFLTHPDEKTVELNSNDFPSLAYGNWAWFNELMGKIDILTNHYTIPTDTYTYLYPDFLAYVSYWNYSGAYTTITVEKYYFDEAVGVKHWVDYCYSLVSQIGITEGMDEKEAIKIINDFVCDFMEPSTEPSHEYTKLFETHLGACGGYSYLFKALCEGAGVEAYAVISNTEYHSWNEVVLDGQAYEIDTCWNDTYNNAYYLLTREQMGAVDYHHHVEIKR